MSNQPQTTINGRKFKFALKFQGEKWKVPGPSFILTNNGRIGQFLSSTWGKFVIPDEASSINMCVVSIPSEASSRDAFNALENGDADILTSVEVTEEELDYAKRFVLQKLSDKKGRHASNDIVAIGDNGNISIKISACQEDDNEESDIVFTLCCPGFDLHS